MKKPLTINDFKREIRYSWECPLCKGTNEEYEYPDEEDSVFCHDCLKEIPII